VPKKFKCPHCGKAISPRVFAEFTGRIGGKKLAATKGADYFRKLQAKRKTRAGGRPPEKEEK
jgi:hypothetical protein